MAHTIGITEGGDASMNYAWVDNLSKHDGAIIITKNLTDKFCKELLQQDRATNHRIILHATCTGHGGTILEPNIMPFNKTALQIRRLIASGFDPERIVIRIDPIVPTKKGIDTFEKVVSLMTTVIPNVKRYRISVLDMYPHVRTRFKNAGLPLPYGENFSASPAQFAAIDASLFRMKIAHPDITFETCAEPKLTVPEQTGCISKKDFDRMGLDFDPTPSKKPRQTCLCSGEKRELLPYQHLAQGYNHCYGCMYCFWKTERDTLVK